VKTVSADLLDTRAVAALPETKILFTWFGLKFGTAQNPAATWAINTLVPARICERYPHSRIVALSTGNVYPNSEVSRGGSVEGDPLTPLGEYAKRGGWGRERIFEFYIPSKRHAHYIAQTVLRDRTALRRAGRHRAKDPLRRGDFTR